MARSTHSALYWQRRCIDDSESSGDANVSPNVGPDQSRRGEGMTACFTSDTETERFEGSAETPTPPHSPAHRERDVSGVSMQTPPSQEGESTSPSSADSPRIIASPTTSSPVLLDTPPRPAHRTETRSRPSGPRPLLRERKRTLHNHRAVTAPYSRPRAVTSSRSSRSVVSPSGVMQASPEPTLDTRSRSSALQPSDEFVLARWPYRVAQLRTSFNPHGIVFPDIVHFGKCDCSSPCRSGECRNSLMHVYCNVNCCPYGGQCGNGVVESTKVFLGRSARTRTLGVVAAETIEAGEVLGEYLGELEHVSADPSKRPRNTGYRLIMLLRPERPTQRIRVAINAEHFGGLMRFVNHSCCPCARFVEVSNRRRTTVVVVTTRAVRKGEEICVDYGPDLWFICRCGFDNCCHRDIQDQLDP